MRLDYSCACCWCKRYCGLLDRYDDNPADPDGTGEAGGGGCAGYHVTYDDGDEEVLGEIDGRDDVHLLDRESGNNDGICAPQHDNAHSPPVEIPRAETIGPDNDEDDRQDSPLGQPLGGYPGGDSLSGQYQVHRPSLERHCETQGNDCGAFEHTVEERNGKDDLGIGNGRIGGAGSNAGEASTNNKFAAISYRYSAGQYSTVAR